MLHGWLAITDLAHTPLQIDFEYMGQNTFFIFVSSLVLLWWWCLAGYLKNTTEIDNFLPSPSALQSIRII